MWEKVMLVHTFLLSMSFCIVFLFAAIKVEKTIGMKIPWIFSAIFSVYGWIWLYKNNIEKLIHFDLLAGYVVLLFVIALHAKNYVEYNKKGNEE